MSRLTALDLNALNDAQREVYEAIASGPRGNMGLAGPFGVYVRAPSVGNAAQNLGAAVRYGTELAENVKEVAICTVGAHFRSKFEFAAHQALAAKAGVDDAIVESLRVGETPVIQDPKEAMAHRVATELLTTRKVADATYAEAVSVMSESEVIELVVTIGYYTTVSMVLNTFMVPIPGTMTDPFPED